MTVAVGWNAGCIMPIRTSCWSLLDGVWNGTIMMDGDWTIWNGKTFEMSFGLVLDGKNGREYVDKDGGGDDGGDGEEQQ